MGPGGRNRAGRIGVRRRRQFRRTQTECTFIPTHTTFPITSTHAHRCLHQSGTHTTGETQVQHWAKPTRKEFAQSSHDLHAPAPEQGCRQRSQGRLIKGTMTNDEFKCGSRATMELVGTSHRASSLQGSQPVMVVQRAGWVDSGACDDRPIPPLTWPAKGRRV